MAYASEQERLADFLAILYSDCNLHCLQEAAPPFSGQVSKETYMRDSAAILKMLRDVEIERLRAALYSIIGLDHHNHGPESRATKIARDTLNHEQSGDK